MTSDGLTEASMVALVRRFNRMATQQAGALDDRFLERDRPLGLSRLLWEIGVEGAELVMLRARLGLDSGQLSRMLRSLEGDGLVVVSASPGDARVRIARLTAAGQAERDALDRLSDDAAAALLKRVDDRRRAELVNAMRTVERVLAETSLELRVEDPAGPVAQRCLRAYTAELNRRAPQRGFDPSKGSTAGPHEVRPPHGAFIVAYLNDEAVGCGAVKHHSGQVSDVKRMWVAEGARGLGVGRALLRHLEVIAAERGSRQVRLETNDVLSEAIALYRSCGYREVRPFNDEPFADRWFSKPLDPPADA